MVTSETTSAMSAEIALRVRKFVLALQASEHAKHVLAVIVAGSASRGEEIWHNGRLLSDIDLMLVTRHTNPIRTRSITNFMSDFRGDGIDGGPTPLPTLRRFRTFAFYEAQATGVVAWGNYRLDGLFPPMTADELPRWEAIRVLSNRMFEYLKFACGRKSAEHAAAKLYEALAEAALAWEGRYRPTYRERLAELATKPPDLLPAPARQAAICALTARLGETSAAPMPSVDVACRHLLSGLRVALSEYMQADDTLTGLLHLLAEREYHWKHRAYWAVVRPRNAATMLRMDPTIELWQQAAVALQGKPAIDVAQNLVDAWNACPPVLRHHDPAYANTSNTSSDHNNSFHKPISW